MVTAGYSPPPSPQLGEIRSPWETLQLAPRPIVNLAPEERHQFFDLLANIAFGLDSSPQAQPQNFREEFSFASAGRPPGSPGQEFYSASPMMPGLTPYAAPGSPGAEFNSSGGPGYGGYSSPAHSPDQAVVSFGPLAYNYAAPAPQLPASHGSPGVESRSRGRYSPQGPIPEQDFMSSGPQGGEPWNMAPQDAAPWNTDQWDAPEDWPKEKKSSRRHRHQHDKREASDSPGRHRSEKKGRSPRGGSPQGGSRNFDRDMGVSSTMASAAGAAQDAAHAGAAKASAAKDRGEEMARETNKRFQQKMEEAQQKMAQKAVNNYAKEASGGLVTNVPAPVSKAALNYAKKNPKESMKFAKSNARFLM